MWNEYLPMSMPITAIAATADFVFAVLGMGVLHSDGAPSSGHYRLQTGQEHGRTIPLPDICGDVQPTSDSARSGHWTSNMPFSRPLDPQIIRRSNFPDSG